jgi:uncharacterized cupredoxin-like copper-binding protein
MLALVLLAAHAPGAPRASAASSVIRVQMTEFAFRPSVIRLAAGAEAKIELVNQGQIAHQFDAPVLRTVPVSVVGGDAHVEAPGLEFLRVQPGGRAQLRFVPRRRGRFPFACTIEGHAEAGMTGVLEVR